MVTFWPSPIIMHAVDVLNVSNRTVTFWHSAIQLMNWVFRSRMVTVPPSATVDEPSVWSRVVTCWPWAAQFRQVKCWPWAAQFMFCACPTERWNFDFQPYSYSWCAEWLRGSGRGVIGSWTQTEHMNFLEGSPATFGSCTSSLEIRRTSRDFSEVY